MATDAAPRPPDPTTRRYRYCPLASGEAVPVESCRTCVHRPAPPYQVCVAPRPARPRRRGFWDREAPPD